MKAIKDIIVAYILITSSVFATQFIAFYLMPHSFWGEYFEVYPEKASYEVGEQISFHSDSARYRPTDITWEDSLYKVRDGGRQLISRAVDKSYHAQVKKRPTNANDNTWNYISALPTEEGTYCLQSKIIYSPMIGIAKVEIYDGCVEGKTFKITKEE